jgi:hypothetical protein
MFTEIMDMLTVNRASLFLPSTGTARAQLLRILFFHVVVATWTLYNPDPLHTFSSFFVHDYSTVTLFARFLGWSTSHALNTPTW